MIRLSFIKNIRDLPTAPRRFLLFSCINLISWQCIVGQVLILFGRSINMPSSWVGILISFLPLSLFLVIFSMSAVEKYGPRKVLIYTWLIRNLFASTVFAIPFAVNRWGEQAAWHILLFATLGFSMVRAFGVSAWFPWLHEVVPKSALGTYFAVETIISQALTIVIMFAIANILGMSGGTYRFYWVYFVGVTTGLISIFYIRRIPGGLRPPLEVATHEKFSAILQALKDKKYKLFIFFIIISMSSIMWINVSSILYLRDILGFSDTKIMIFMAFGAFGITLTVRYWSKHAERYGSHKTMSILIGAHSLIAFSWFAVIPDASWTAMPALPIIIAGSVFSAGFSIVAYRGMMCLVPLENRVGYTSLWIVGISIANGIPPIIAGKLIDIFQISGFRFCFLISGICGILAALLWNSFRIDDEDVPISDIHLMIRPMQPLRSVSRLVWMILTMKKKDNG
jgi:MFS family permease